MNDDEFRSLLKSGEKVFGPDLWKDKRFRDVRIGKTNTTASQVFLYGAFAAWAYFLYDVVIANVGWIIGGVLIAILSVLMYRMPVIHIIQPLEQSELAEYLGAEPDPDPDDRDFN